MTIGHRWMQCRGGLFLPVVLAAITVCMSFPTVAGAAGIVVTTTADSGPGSLRQAILDANANPGADSIAFRLPKSDPGFDATMDAWTIKPVAPLPYFTDDGLFVDGESQARFSGVMNATGPQVQLDGSLISGQYTGLVIDASWCRVGGLAISRFGGYGISITASHSANVIFRCHVGVSPDGIHAAPNGGGIYLYNASWNFVSWVDSTFANVIGCNNGAGIEIRGAGAQFNYVGPNFIGTDVSRSEDLGNGGDGILIREGASDNSITDYANPNNVAIWNNTGAGIHVDGATSVRNFLAAGSVTGNARKGILLENGGNGALPAPVIQEVTNGEIRLTTQPQRVVAFFQDPGSQAREYIGFAYSDASGHAVFKGTFGGPHFTAMAIDTTTGATKNNSSELSAPFIPAPAVVTTTADAGAGSLRQVLEYVNMLGIPDTIRFAIPAIDPGYNAQLGTWTIKPATKLPYLNARGTSIDGYSQSRFIGVDSNPYGPEIELDGSLLSDGDGLVITAGGSGAEIVRLAITHFPGSGIDFVHTDYARVTACYIGTDARGTKSAPNSEGIVVAGGSTYVYLGSGHGVPGNLISGNTGMGIMIRDSSRYVHVNGNIIGLDRSASQKLANTYSGVIVMGGASFNFITGNRVGGNNVGIEITEAHHNAIIANEVGTDSSFSIDRGNVSDGIRVSDAHNSDITFNTVGYNGGDGVVIFGPNSLYNLISGNRISHNAGPGIWLGNGANGSPPEPKILSLKGPLVKGTAGPYDSVEVFQDENAEGEEWVGATKADTNGVWTLILSKSPTMPYLTATAQDAKGNSSQFSPPFATGVTGVADRQRGPVPAEFLLFQNYPNPFNPSTVIRYGLPQDTYVLVELFTVLGERIAVLEEGERKAGYHEISVAGGPGRLASGVYFYRLKAMTGARRYERTMKMMVLR